MKSFLSSFEVTCIVKELQFLVGSKVEKIFQTSKPKEDFLFSLHVPSKGKQFLFVSLPQLVCLSSFKPDFPEAPPHFCSSLRRKLTNARVMSIEQVNFERIIKIGFSTKHGLSELIIELIPPGNMCLVLPEEQNKIIAVFHPKIWSDDRKILPNKEYKYPPSQIDPRTLSIDSFIKLISNSDKESIVKTMAIDVSLGGLYAKEVLSFADIDHNTQPSDLSKDQIKKIFESLNDLFKRDLAPLVVNGEALPFSVNNFSDGEKKETFNEAVASVILSSLEKTEQREQQKSSKEELSKVQKVLKSQQASLENLEKAKDEKRKKGELIYNHYVEVQDLLNEILTLRNSHSWDEIKEHYKDHPLNVKIDEHKGLLYLELE